jgi:hypothetical protein
MKIKLPKKLRRKLLGVWRSDEKMTRKFNDKYSKMSKKPAKMFYQMIGKMVIEYCKDNTLKVSIPENIVERSNGEKYTFEASESEELINIVTYTDDSIVFESENEFLGKLVTTIHFEGKNRYWVYLAEGYSGIHGREYFRKEKSSKKNTC